MSFAECAKAMTKFFGASYAALGKSMSPKKALSICVVALLSQLAVAQDYARARLPGTNISIQYPNELIKEEATGTPALAWNDDANGPLHLVFGKIDETELEELLAGWEGLREWESTEGFGYVTEPRKLRINSYDTTELKIVHPAYALLVVGLAWSLLWRKSSAGILS
jgi:hypothetical protein